MGIDSHKISSLGYEAAGAAFSITQRLAALKRCTLYLSSMPAPS